MSTFNSQFRTTPIPGSYQAYLVYENASIQKIILDPIALTFKIVSLNWNISKNVDGIFYLNGSLIDIQKQ
jgi:hypothetical protein